MSIDLKTTNIEPIRRTFDHLAEKIGPTLISLNRNN